MNAQPASLAIPDDPVCDDAVGSKPVTSTVAAMSAAVAGGPGTGETPGWRARLELGFDADPGRTVLRHRRHFGPLTVQRGFHPEGAPCHSYLLHPPGGVVGGDRLELDVAVGRDAHALVTTPAAGKFYRSAGPRAVQRQLFRIGAGAVLEWLPALNILHGGARLSLHSRFELAAGARLLAWDHTCLGRPGSGDRFASGELDSALEVAVEGHPLLHERIRVSGGGALLDAPWGLQGRRYFATLLAWPARPEMRDHLRGALSDGGGLGFGATLLAAPGAEAAGSGLLVCRWLAVDGETLWTALVRAWSLLRPLLLDRAPCLPRIWST